MSRILRNVVLALIVFIWVIPFVALVTTSLRSETASKTSGIALPHMIEAKQTPS